ncbi:glycogen/starch synthase, ADP-glucose type [Malonomonas rubra DSM 5091]|uniref:Glycogen synthase n=1 Tax=Malonomonas rubra DSM 5091 TaxID=1122189 RepID=A0A1M6J9P5_MALRU|nr:glycogen synthase GlgA [Malonomonas rubra]SHJ43393.1 glycogen/starch synthase, ADP-glucose type [Malonomonas rubra DSM 5091]
MPSLIREKLYPLGVHCGHSFWHHIRLTDQFRQVPPPPRTFFRQLIAEELRRSQSDSLSAAELELLATINQVLLEIGRHFLRGRNCKVTRHQILVDKAVTPLPQFEKILLSFLQLFPNLPVELNQKTLTKLLQDCEEKQQLDELLLELFLLYTQSHNRAIRSADRLFLNEERQLQQQSRYQQQLQQIDSALPELDDGFARRPQSLLERLREPLQQGGTLESQLQWLQQQWSEILPEELRFRIDSAITIFQREGITPDFPGEPQLDALNPASQLDQEYANFTADLDWMPRTVLLAKSTYVWLQQLSRKYHWHIHRLDQIPDQELDELASFGFTSLWLIGIWHRSKASLKIKNLTGQQQVAASAYAIDDYRVADDLGGDGALDNLRHRCQQRGIDLACDVVTNHTGIESAWLQQHPDWFIQAQHPPYPGYQFSGIDLSENPDYSMQIEDGYYDHSEAAVVCRYQHRHTGEVRYIYHGNDGTHLPWNDTVQLNYLLPQVREAMIALIIRVAKQFRVIRFDAAMTLAKRHFQRLWFPLPGGGEGVPSRSDYAMSKQEFDSLFPVEFWRELVDRVNQEVPDTLLVAEAFWLMEGYFVRTLGMHRVYNSAFMNMLKREENEKYRQTVKNILAFDPAILQRFVNFMSNPDEEPAIEQFGRDDKYFCIATMLATMPGLPMFGHGQIEGYTEKYGMEYISPRWQEEPDQHLIERHRRQIFPLLRQRALFSGAEDFQLYDFASEYGVEEHVYVYSNRLGDQNTLVICNNSPHQIKGRIGNQAHRADNRQTNLTSACHIDLTADFIIFTDIALQQQYLLPTGHMTSGGEFELQPYAARVLSHFTAVHDHDGRWQQIWQRYGLSPRADLYTDYEAILLESVLEVNAKIFALENVEHIQAEVVELITQLLAELSKPELQQRSSEDMLQLLIRVLFRSPQTLNEKLINEFVAFVDDQLNLQEKTHYNWLDRLFNQAEWRKLLKCNYYNEEDYCNQEAFETLLTTFFLCSIHHSRESTSNNINGLDKTAFPLLINILKLRSKAEISGYQVDNFLQSLDSGPEPSPVLPAATGGKYSMKILFVASEATPFAKTGGLADVVGSLPRALRQLGHDVRVVLPCYRSAERCGVTLRKGRKSVEIALDGKNYRGSLKQTSHDGVPFWFIDCPQLFDRPELYGNVDGDYPDNSLRFGFFSRAVLEMIRRLDFRPDVIHLHDWQTSFIPALLRTEYRHNPFYGNIATLLTIHNLGYQGRFSPSIIQQLGLHESVGTPKGMEYFGEMSVLKGGINYSDVINTVSPTYCEEIKGQEQGHGFDGILREREEDLHGIINGLDRRSWDPALDPALPTPFNAENLNGKRACKRLVQKQLGLEIRHDVPIVALISRLDRQKGINLVEQAWPQLMEKDIQFVLLGSGDRNAMAFWREQQKQRPGKVSINLTFDEGLSRRIFAASDLLLVPSLYEPCGLTQMIALHYGALPVVRRTGGLADTVIDATEHSRSGYGFVFDNFDSNEMLAAIDRALEIYPQRSRWLTLVKRGMTRDFSWNKSAIEYHELYTKARDYRQMPAA